MILRRITRALPVILGCSIIVVVSTYAQGASPAHAAGAALFITLASGRILAILLMIRQMGRSTRRQA